MSTNRGASSKPDIVGLEVRRDADKKEICSASVAPSTTFHQKTSFEKSCGRIESGKHWIYVSRPNEDGWHVQGSGTLTTK